MPPTSDRETYWMPLFRGFLACPAGRRPQGKARIHWKDCIFHLAGECPRNPQEDQEDVAGEKGIWASLLRLLPLPQWTQRSRRKWMDIKPQTTYSFLSAADAIPIIDIRISLLI